MRFTVHSPHDHHAITAENGDGRRCTNRRQKNRKESPWTAHAHATTPEMFRALWLMACWQRWHVPEKRVASAQAGAR
jgi:hypothetical protein